METYDLRLKFPFTWLVTGGSGSGKTTKVTNFLLSHKNITNNPNCSNVIYCYNEWQNGFNLLQEKNVVTDWHQGLPDMQTIKEKIEPHISDGSILVIDDFGQHLNATYVDLFTVLSHHNNCSVILLTQNLFAKNPIFRTISLNCKYISVFKNPRDNSQIASFARQVSPNKYKAVIDSFHKATVKPYSYIFFDFHQETPTELRVRSRILPHELPMICWIPK